jgi:periplasmic protein TonB
MDRDFVLPITFAAVAHAALFFGITKTPHASATLPDVVLLRPFPTFPNDPEPPVVELEDSEPRKAKTVIETPTYRTPEPPPVDAGPQMVMQIPALNPVAPNDGTKIVPDGVPGDVLNLSDRDWPKEVLPGQLDNPPRTRFQVAPMYPFEGKRDGMRGEVLVEFVVDETGAVHDPHVVRSSHRMFDEPTLRAVSKWKFEPGRRGGRVVRFKMSVPVVFNLNE